GGTGVCGHGPSAAGADDLDRITLRRCASPTGGVHGTGARRTSRALVAGATDGGGPRGTAHAAVGKGLDEPLAQGTHQEAQSPGTANADSWESDISLSPCRSLSQTKSESVSKMTFTAVAWHPPTLRRSRSDT